MGLADAERFYRTREPKRNRKCQPSTKTDVLYGGKSTPFDALNGTYTYKFTTFCTDGRVLIPPGRLCQIHGGVSHEQSIAEYLAPDRDAFSEPNPLWYVIPE
jgi:hypothetical protein